MRRTSAGRT
jgi:hypothetical protein